MISDDHGGSDVVGWWEMVLLKGCKECKVVLWIKARHSGICGAYKMFAKQEPADEVRWTAACPPINIRIVRATRSFGFGFKLGKLFCAALHLLR